MADSGAVLDSCVMFWVAFGALAFRLAFVADSRAVVEFGLMLDSGVKFGVVDSGARVFGSTLDSGVFWLICAIFGVWLDFGNAMKIRVSLAIFAPHLVQNAPFTSTPIFLISP